MNFWAVAEAVAIDRKTSATVAVAEAEDRRFEKVWNKEVRNTYKLLRTLWTKVLKKWDIIGKMSFKIQFFSNRIADFSNLWPLATGFTFGQTFCRRYMKPKAERSAEGETSGRSPQIWKISYSFWKKKILKDILPIVSHFFKTLVHSVLKSL